MSVRINTNIEALNAQRNLSTSALAFGKSVEKLSSGLRINRAADDASGLAISEGLRAQVNGLNQASRNAQDAISMVQTAEGALNEVHSMLQRMRELTVQAANGTISDPAPVTAELDELKTEITRLANSTQFNGKNLLDGTTGAGITAAGTNVSGVGGTSNGYDAIKVRGAAAGVYTLTSDVSLNQLTLTDATGNSQTVILGAAPAAGTQATVDFNSLGVSLTVNENVLGVDLAANNTFTVGAGGTVDFQVGANGVAGTDTLSVDFADVSGLSVLTGTVDVSTQALARASISVIDLSIASVSASRGLLGAAQNRLEHTIAAVGVGAENLTASESRIRDLDVAAEMVKFTKTQILQQAGTAILAQANQAPQNILTLLR